MPPDVAEYLVGIDMGGHSVVRTPLAQKTLWDEGLEGLLPLAFQAMLGAGQGTVDAPTNWNAVFDILLDALDTIPTHFTFQNAHGFACSVDDMAAADDLLSTCGTLESLRLKAEVVSAFCIIFGLDIATSKLRTYHVRWGNENSDLLDGNGNPYRDASGCIDTRDYITVYSGDWHGEKVKLEEKGMMRYLGIHWDMDYSGQTIMNMTTEKLDAALARIQTFPCTADIKKTALERCVYMSLVYQLKFANWPLSIFVKLDQRISACIKRIIGLSQKYPSELLYVSGKYGGHNFARLSDVVHMAKLAILHRYQAPRLMVADNYNGFHPAVMSSLLGRVLRAGGVVVPPGEHIDIVHSGGHWWGCSLVEWLGQMNLTITMEGLKRYALAVPSASEVADIIDRKGVMSLECEDPASTAEVPLRVGQCWGIPILDEELGSTSVYEILSFNENTAGEAVISLLQWECPHPLATGRVVRASNRSRSGMHRGVTSRLHYPISRLLSEEHRHSCFLVALDKERHTEHVADTWCKITCITPRTLSTDYTPDALLDPCPAMLHHFTESTLYTDGSAYKTGSVEDFLKGKEATIATGAIVGTNDGDHYTATRVDFATTKLTPYLTELMTTMYARRRSTADIVSDCQGSLKTLQRARKGRRPKGAQGHVTAAYSYPTIRERTEAR